MTNFETHIFIYAYIYIHRKCKIPGTYIPVRGILMRVASVGCFPGAWRRGSWHFQDASWHLQSSMDLLFVRFTLYFSFLSKRSGRRGVCRPRSEAPCIYYTQYMNAVSGLLSWNMELLAFASRQSAPKIVDLSVSFIRVLFFSPL